MRQRMTFARSLVHELEPLTERYMSLADDWEQVDASSVLYELKQLRSKRLHSFGGDSAIEDYEIGSFADGRIPRDSEFSDTNDETSHDHDTSTEYDDNLDIEEQDPFAQSYSMYSRGALMTSYSV